MGKRQFNLTSSTDIQRAGSVNSTTNAQPQSINKHGEITGSGLFRNKTGKFIILNFPDANLTEASAINDDVRSMAITKRVVEGFTYSFGMPVCS